VEEEVNAQVAVEEKVGDEAPILKKERGAIQTQTRKERQQFDRK
jgi:hypothetical protein